MEVNEKYRCIICGNEVVLTKVGGGTLVCCGEKMELIEQDTKTGKVLGGQAVGEGQIVSNSGQYP